MALTPVELRAPAGLTLTLELFPYDSDVLANPGGDALTEATNRRGLYTALVAEPLVGWHTAHVMLHGQVIAVYDVYLEDDTDVHRGEDAPQRLHDGGDGGRLQTGAGTNQLLLDAGKVLLQPTQAGVTIPTVTSVGSVVSVGAVSTVASVTGGVTLAPSESIFPADIQLTIDAGNSRDEYTVGWFQNGTPITGGVSSPTIEVVRRSDGVTLVPAGTPLTPIGSTGALKYDESTNRLASGEAAIVTVSAIIAGSARSWRRIVSRDDTP